MLTPSTPITVSQLTTAIKQQLEKNFFTLHVQGEMSNCTLHSSGHLYFDLKDAGAKIPVVLFRAKEQLTRPPKEGDKVLLRGSLSVYPPHGKYQIIASSLEYQGVGALLLQLEATKKKLAALGWFDKEKKKKLPPFPRTVGVVTSPTGAVIRDIIQITSRRHPGIQVLLNPVRVQGSEAAAEIARAITQMNQFQLCDVLIVGRGGGSLEDLWPFNEELVAEAIFRSTIPILSAVGHETDVTLSDFVADLRASTPSAAAEIVTASYVAAHAFLQKTHHHLQHTLRHRLTECRLRLHRFRAHPLLATSYSLLGAPLQRLDELKTYLDLLIRKKCATQRALLVGRSKEVAAYQPTKKIETFRAHLEQQQKRLHQTIHYLLSKKAQQLKEILHHLHALNPKNVLERGYAILFALNRKSVIVSAHELSPGEQVEVLLGEGGALLTIDQLYEGSDHDPSILSRR